MGRFDGRAAISAIPALVQAKGSGTLRHHLSNVMLDRTGNARELEMHAYCLVTDWSRQGAMVACFDFHARLQNRCHWQVAELSMNPVGACDGGHVDMALTDKIAPGMMLN